MNSPASQQPYHCKQIHLYSSFSWFSLTFFSSVRTAWFPTSRGRYSPAWHRCTVSMCGERRSCPFGTLGRSELGVLVWRPHCSGCHPPRWPLCWTQWRRRLSPHRQTIPWFSRSVDRVESPLDDEYWDSVKTTQHWSVLQSSSSITFSVDICFL